MSVGLTAHDLSRGFCRSCTPSAPLGLEDSAGYSDSVQDRANPLAPGLVELDARRSTAAVRRHSAEAWGDAAVVVDVAQLANVQSPDGVPIHDAAPDADDGDALALGEAARLGLPER